MSVIECFVWANISHNICKIPSNRNMRKWIFAKYQMSWNEIVSRTKGNALKQKQQQPNLEPFSVPCWSFDLLLNKWIYRFFLSLGVTLFPFNLMLFMCEYKAHRHSYRSLRGRTFSTTFCKKYSNAKQIRWKSPEDVSQTST